MGIYGTRQVILDAVWLSSARLGPLCVQRMMSRWSFRRHHPGMALLDLPRYPVRQLLVETLLAGGCSWAFSCSSHPIPTSSRWWSFAAALGFLHFMRLGTAALFRLWRRDRYAVEWNDEYERDWDLEDMAAISREEERRAQRVALLEKAAREGGSR